MDQEKLERKQFFSIMRKKKLNEDYSSIKTPLNRSEPDKPKCMGRGFIGMPNWPLKSKSCSKSATHLVYFVDDTNFISTKGVSLDVIRQFYKNKLEQADKSLVGEKYTNCQCSCDARNPCRKCIAAYYDRPIHMCSVCMGLTEFDYVEPLIQHSQLPDQHELPDKLGKYCCGLGYMQFRSKCEIPGKQCQNCMVLGSHVKCGKLIPIFHYLACNEKPVHNIGDGYVLCNDCNFLFQHEITKTSTFEQKVKRLLEKK